MPGTGGRGVADLLVAAGGARMILPLLAEPTRHPRDWPYRMAICGAYELRRGFLAGAGTHILGIQRRNMPFGEPLLTRDRHLILEFDDVTDPARPEAPSVAHLEAAMAFVDNLPEEAALVIHCMQGVSRSTALALGLLAREVPPLRAGHLLHSLRPSACPNPLLVRLWDDLLGLRGELVQVAERFPTVVWRKDGCEPLHRRLA